MTTILLIRHGQTQWNQDQIFRGRADIPLSELGMRQARALSERLAEERLAAVYSSPLSRALATAECLAQPHGLVPQAVDGLTDLDYGAWQGRRHEQVKQDHPDLYATWTTAPERFRPPGGESLADVRHRAMAALEQILARHPEDTLAVVSHRVVNKVLLCAALGLGDEAFWRVRQDTCCLNRLCFAGAQATISLLNDTCHLRGLAADAADF